MNTKESEAAERLRKQWSGPMTEAEIAFFKDVQGFVDFAVRNGLNFPVVVSALLHDLNEIARNGFEYDKMKASGFVPKIAGYANLTEDAFGMTEEPSA